MKTFSALFLGAVILSVVWYFYTVSNKDDVVQVTQMPIMSPKDATYIIDGARVTLHNGVAEQEVVAGSASKIVTRYFGNEVTHDIDGDGRVDTAFLLTQETGGSGVFYYLVAALNKESGYIGSKGIFIGDRIAPQSTSMGDGNIIVVNYADRAVGEDFSTQPSIGKSISALLDPTSLTFGEVAQDFEGEADPSKMTLSMNKWKWIKATTPQGDVMPQKSDAFTLSFNNDGTFSASTDCNGVGGEYVAGKTSLSFDKMMSTLMYCEGSQERVFSDFLSNTEGFVFTSRGELILTLKDDGGTVIFR